MAKKTEAQTQNQPKEKKPKRLKCKTESVLREDGHDFIKGSMLRATKKDGKVTAMSVPDKEKVTVADLKPVKLNAADSETLSGKLAEGQTKHYVQRKCTKSGDLFWCATSDLHQTTVCDRLREEMRKEKAKQQRKEKVAAVKQENEELKARLAELEAEQKTA